MGRVAEPPPPRSCPLAWHPPNTSRMSGRIVAGDDDLTGDALPDDYFYRVVKRTDDSLTENGEISNEQWLRIKHTLSIKFEEELNQLRDLMTEHEAGSGEFLASLSRVSGYGENSDDTATDDDWTVKVNAQHVFWPRHSVHVDLWHRAKIHMQIFVDSILTGTLVEDVFEQDEEEGEITTSTQVPESDGGEMAADRITDAEMQHAAQQFLIDVQAEQAAIAHAQGEPRDM